MPLHQRMFIANPLAYLSTRPRLSPLRISVLGGPVSGKTTQAKLLASIYGLVYISLDEVFEEWGALSVEEGVAKWGSVFEKIVRKCRLGKTMPAEMVVEVVKGVVKRVGESGQVGCWSSFSDESCHSCFTGEPRSLMDGFWMVFQRLLIRCVLPRSQQSNGD